MMRKTQNADFLKQLHDVLDLDEDAKVSSIQEILDKDVGPIGGTRRKNERRFLCGEITFDEYLELLENPLGG